MPRGEHPPIHELNESPFISLEHWLEHDLERQYQSEAKIMLQTGDLELLPEAGEMGIIGIDGKEYPLPSLDTVGRELTKIKERKELIERKMQQGFTTLDLTPFAYPIKRLMAGAEKVIRKHHADGKLFTTRKNPADANEPLVTLELNTSQPLLVWDKLIDGDVNGELKYFVNQFDKNNHGGKTKQELLDQAIRSGAPWPGWDVSLQEANINLPRPGKGQLIGGRKQLETNQTSIDYLKLLQTNPSYHGESGTTVEQWLTRLKKILEQYDQVIDDFAGNGSLNYLLAQYLPASDSVPSGFWYRVNGRAYVDRYDPRGRDDDYGVRPAVRIG